MFRFVRSFVMDKNDVFFKYKDTCSIHKELTNILLLCMEESNYYYCYCDSEKRTTCSLCDLCQFLSDKNNKIENLSCKKFLQLNYAKREKLDMFINLISLFLIVLKLKRKQL